MALTKLTQRDHTNAVIATLTGAGLVVGDAVRNTEPDGSGAVIPPPCVVVHPIPGGRRFGTLDDYVKDADLLYQLTCVGETRDQAEWVRDETEILLDGVTVAGRQIDVIRLDFGSDEARLDGTVHPAVFVSMPRYRLSSTPA